jgi:hypothetical protein
MNMSTDDKASMASPFGKVTLDPIDDGDVSMESDWEETWDDQKIDNEAKLLLGERRFGQLIPSDAVAHLEFFYNTLQMSHKTENPFENPEKYPALLYEENSSPETLLDIHRRITKPLNPMNVS